MRTKLLAATALAGSLLLMPLMQGSAHAVSLPSMNNPQSNVTLVAHGGGGGGGGGAHFSGMGGGGAPMGHAMGGWGGHAMAEAGLMPWAEMGRTCTAVISPRMEEETSGAGITVNSPSTTVVLTSTSPKAITILITTMAMATASFAMAFGSGRTVQTITPMVIAGGCCVEQRSPAARIGGTDTTPASAITKMS